jgi:hypothetical protein
MPSWRVIYQSKPGKLNDLGAIEAKTKAAATKRALAIVPKHVPDVDEKDVWVVEPRKAN